MVVVWQRRSWFFSADTSTSPECLYDPPADARIPTLRRLRLGLITPNGGMDLLPRIHTPVQPELGWEEARWEQEVREYADLWKRSYGPK